MATWCEHCFVTANQFLKNPGSTILYKNTAPLKNFIKNKKNPRTSADVPGVKMATETIKEKQMNKVNLAEGHITLAHSPKRSVHSRQRGSN